MGKPAARIGDMHTCPMVTPGTPPIPHVGGPVSGPCVPTVLIGGVPAAVMGDMCVCVGPPDTIIMGSTGVFIGGKPAARMGDPTAHGGVVMAGCPTVLIGEVAPGGPQPPVMPLPMKVAMQQMGAHTAAVADQILTMKKAAKNGTPFCEKCAKARMQAESKNNPNVGGKITLAKVKDWVSNALKALKPHTPVNKNASYVKTPPDSNLVGQKKQNTCAMASIAMAIKKLSNVSLSEEDVIAESQKHPGGYTAKTGTKTGNIAPTINGLNVGGITAKSELLAKPSDLYSKINEKSAAVVAVDNEDWFGSPGGHAVTVIGVTTDSKGNKIYIVNDPWGDPPPKPAGNGKTLLVPAKDFEDSMIGPVVVLSKPAGK